MKQRTAATGSERQAKYRKSRQLGAVFLTEATRQAINALQLRTGLKKEAVVARAVRKLVAYLDQEEHRRTGASSSHEAFHTATHSEAAARAAPPVGGVPGDADRAPSLSDDNTPRPKRRPKSEKGQTPPASADPASKRHSRGRARSAERKGKPQPEIPDLFDDLLPRR